MRFDLFGFDLLPKDRLFGVWLCSVKNYEDIHRSLFTLYYMEGDVIFELFYMRLATVSL